SGAGHEGIAPFEESGGHGTGLDPGPAAVRAKRAGFAMRRPLAMKACHSARSAQRCVATATREAARWTAEGSARVCAAPPRTNTAMAERMAKVAGGEVFRLNSRKAARTLRRSASGKAATSSLTRRPVPMKKKITIDWEKRERRTVGIA